MAELGLIFDEDPELYERARPGYPPEVFQALRDLAGLGPDARVLEVGAGTGQATRDLLAAGADLTIVEPGAGLAAALRRKFAPAVHVLETSFEAWEPDGAFDLITAFTAWHWLDPAVRTSLAARALRPGGSLATVTTDHVRGGTETFFDEMQLCYERWADVPPGLRTQPADEVPPFLDEADESPAFEPATRVRFESDITYTTSSYLDVLQTYSGHRALSAFARNGLLGCVGELIDSRYGGAVTKRYLYEVRVAVRR